MDVGALTSDVVVRDQGARYTPRKWAGLALAVPDVVRVVVARRRGVDRSTVSHMRTSCADLPRWQSAGCQVLSRQDLDRLLGAYTHRSPD